MKLRIAENRSASKITINPIKNLRVVLIKAGSLALILLPPALMLFWVGEFAVNVPIWDEWSMAPLVVKLHTGGLTFADIWTPHNEHRVAVLRIMLLALAKLWGWDIVKDAYFGFVVTLLSFGLIWYLIRYTIQSRFRVWLMFNASLLVFSMVQWEIWAQGFALVWFLENFWILLCIVFLSRCQGSWRGLLLGIGAAVMATYTLGNGMLVWPGVFVGMLFHRRVWRWTMIVTWVASACISLGIYFYDYHAISSHTNLFYFVGHPLELGEVVGSYLGAVYGIWAGPQLSIILGVFGVVVFILSAVSLWYRSTRGAYKDWEISMPWLQLGLCALLTAGLTASGRADAEVKYLLVSHYTTPAILFWVSLQVIVFVVFRRLYLDLTGSNQAQSLVGYAHERVSKNKAKIAPVLPGVVIVGGIFLFICYILCYEQGLTNITERQKDFSQSQAFLYEYDSVRDEPLQVIYPDISYLKQIAWSIKQYHEGSFNISASEYHQQLEDKWHNQMSPENYNVRLYPGELIRSLDGADSAVTEQDSLLSFTHSGSSPTSFIVDGKLLGSRKTQFLGWNLESQGLDIEFRQAQFVNIHWSNGKSEKFLYGIEDSKGWKHFRMLVPAGVESLAISAYYRSGRTDQDKMKIEVYDRK
jgi:hypothetical protein